MKKVFLGGTCNGSTWRDALIKDLQIDYFQPQGEDWTPEMMEEEIKQKPNVIFASMLLLQKWSAFILSRKWWMIATNVHIKQFFVILLPMKTNNFPLLK
jgi:hypothetical protein